MYELILTGLDVKSNANPCFCRNLDTVAILGQSKTETNVSYTGIHIHMYEYLHMLLELNLASWLAPLVLVPFLLKNCCYTFEGQFRLVCVVLIITCMHV